MAFTLSDYTSDLTLTTSTLTSLLSTPSPPSTSVTNVTRAVERLKIRLPELLTMVTAEEGRVLRVRVGNLERQCQSLAAYAGPGDHRHQQGRSDQTETAYMQTTQTVMAAQDDMLSELGAGVGRLADQARLIEDESKMHVRLLDEMEGGVESATEGLRAEAKHAEKIREQTSVCKLYIVIACLTGLLVFLLVMGFSH